MQCLTYMGELIEVIRFKYKSLLGSFEGPKHDPELKKIADTINMKVYVCQEKVTHF